MKILGICGSPVKKGNNEQAIDFALNIAKEKGFETERLVLSGYKIQHCIACDACKKQPKCSINDDMNSLYSKIKSADAFIVSSPVYMGSVSSLLKCFMDRTVLLRRQGFLLKNKIGAAIAIGASRNGGQEYVLQNIHAWMHIHGIIVVGDCNHFGGIAVKPFESDEIGKKTVTDTMGMLCGLLEKLKLSASKPNESYPN